MSDLDRATSRAARKVHERARALASDAVDMDLDAADRRWLADHLATCAECRAIANEYRALHDELRALPTPEPPRDLRARTSAALDQIDHARAQRAAARGWRGLSLRPGEFAGRKSVLGPALAMALVAVVAGVTLLHPGPQASLASPTSTGARIAATTPSPSNPEAAVAVVDGNSYWVTPEGGVYQIKGGTTECAGAASKCAVTNANGEVLGSIASTSNVSVVISPAASNAAVWTGDKVVILPLTANPQTVSIDLLTPRPTAPATTPRATTASTAEASPTPATSAGTSSTVLASLAPTETPAASPIETASALPTEAPTPAPTSAPATPQPSRATGAEPTAILEGYRVVGRGPEFSSDGQWLAFSARPVADKSGSDVFVWHVGWDRARPVTTAHADLFAGWMGPRVLISSFTARGADGSVIASSYICDPTDGDLTRIERPMLMPVADPTGRYVVYWSGSVRFDAATGLWGPAQGDLYFDTWANVQAQRAAPAAAPTPTAMPADGTPAPDESTNPVQSETPSAEPTATPAQPSATPGQGPLPQLLPASKAGSVSSWMVRWDATGRYVAIWVANAGSDGVGRVTLLDVLPGRDLLDVDNVLLSTAARSNVAFDRGKFVYTLPADGKTYLFALPVTPPAPKPTSEVTPTPQSSAQPSDSPSAS